MNSKAKENRPQRGYRQGAEAMRLKYIENVAIHGMSKKEAALAAGFSLSMAKSPAARIETPAVCEAIAKMTGRKQREVLQRAEEERRRPEYNRIDSFYPDAGPLRRELYPKHVEFFQLGKIHRERLFLAGNRVGKTEGIGCYEVTVHLTGRYPHWWNGRRFDREIEAWAVGDTSKTVHREILQPKLLGKPGRLGTGMIPKDAIIRTVAKPNVPEAIETVYVRHVSGGESILTFKSYEQGRESFQGAEKDVIWLDEECPKDIYVECLMRTMTTDGLTILTFTPLNGMTELVKDFLGADYQLKDTV